MVGQKKSDQINKAKNKSLKSISKVVDAYNDDNKDLFLAAPTEFGPISAAEVKSEDCSFWEPRWGKEVRWWLLWRNAKEEVVRLKVSISF